MDHAVALVQTYLHVNGYFTVAEFPVPEALRKGRYRTATDIDLLALRPPRAGGIVPARASEPAPFTPDPALDAPGAHADLILAEVKEGKATLNRGARSPAVLRAVLHRFGCCPEEELTPTMRDLLAHGRAQVASGLQIRLLAFGATTAKRPGFHAISLSHVLEFLEEHLTRHWEVLRTTQVRDPAFGFLALLRKAKARV